MVNPDARAKLAEDRRLQQMMAGFSAMMGANNQKRNNERVFSFKMQEEADPEELSSFNRLEKGLALLIKTVQKIRVDLPSVFQIRGGVDVESLPPVQIANLRDLGGYFSSLETRINRITDAIAQIKIEAPRTDTREITKTLQKSLSSLEKTISDLKESQTVTVEGGISSEDSEKLTGIEDAIRKFTDFEMNKITLAPPTVTNVNVNALNGAIKTTAATVTSTPTPLPTYGVLANRRSLVIYNNDPTATIYYGGSEVSTSNGIPIPALSYSPILDAGVSIIPYAVASTGSVNVRVMEISNSAKGM